MTEEEVQDHEPAEEENGDDEEEPYDAQQKIESLQKPAFRVFAAREASKTRESRDGRIRTGDHSAPSRVRYLTAPRPDARALAIAIIPDGPHAIIDRVARAATYIRTDLQGELPSAEDQREVLQAYAAREGYEILASYEDLDAPGFLLYHRPGVKRAISNIKEEEDWEVLLVAHPRCVSDTESAVHELVHKFSLYNNRLECPVRSWEEFLSAMKSYRREMSRR